MVRREQKVWSSTYHLGYVDTRSTREIFTIWFDDLEASGGERCTENDCTMKRTTKDRTLSKALKKRIFRSFEQKERTYALRFNNAMADVEIKNLHKRLHHIFQHILDDTIGGVPFHTIGICHCFSV